MKNAFRLLALVLALCLACSFVSCGKDDPTDDNQESNVNANVVAIAGDYLIDATDYGMPMKWYLRIGADETFKISTKSDFSVDKGNGTVGEKDGNYLLVYSDSTTENSKTASFTVSGGNLIFSTAIPVGAASVANKDDTSDGTVVVLSLAYQDYYGEYVGSYAKVAMGSSIVYNYSFILGAGKAYSFRSEYSMMGSTYSFEEKGTYAISGNAITITPEGGEAVNGTIADKAITIAVKSSDKASERVETILTYASTADVAGTYLAKSFSSAMGGMTKTGTLTLDKIGGYKLENTVTTMRGTSDYSEEGTFVVDGTKLTFTATKKDGEALTEAATPYELTLGTLSVKGTVQTAGNASEFTFVDVSLVGTFVGEEDSEEANRVVVTLNLGADLAFTFNAKTVDDSGDDVTFTGTAVLGASAMGAEQLTLNVTEKDGEAYEASFVALIGDGKLNLQDAEINNVGDLMSFELTPLEK